MLSLVCVVAGLAVWSFAAAEQPAEKSDKTEVRVGVFDSRAVAVAYAHSDWNAKRLKAKIPEMEKAKAAGDTKKIEELDKWGKAQQAKLHRQGFGTAPVHDLLKHVKDEIPQIAKETGVDIIISKWDVVYQNPSVELVDITDKIVEPFRPSQKTLSIIKDLVKQPPVSEEVLEKMKCGEHPKNK
jgi:hypothetical protein